MNIDELKAAWRQDKAPEVSILAPQVIGRTSSAISRVRTNMHNEFIGVIFSYVVLIWFLMREQRMPLLFNLTCIMLYVITYDRILLF